MRKFLSFVAACLFVVVLSACGGSSSKEQVYTLTSEGVGDLKFGVKYSEIPESIDGLYTRLDIQTVDPADSFEGEVAYITLYDGDEKFGYLTAYNSMDEKFDYITIYSPKVQSTSGFKPGDKATVLLDKDIKYDNYYYLIVDGYGVALDGMPQSYKDKHQDAFVKGTEMTLTAEDMTDDSVIYEISKGL